MNALPRGFGLRRQSAAATVLWNGQAAGRLQSTPGMPRRRGAALPAAAQDACPTLSGRGGGRAIPEGVKEAFEDEAAVGVPEDFFARVLGVRHHAGHVAAFVANAGDVLDRAVRIRVIGQLSFGIRILPED